MEATAWPTRKTGPQHAFTTAPLRDPISASQASRANCQKQGLCNAERVINRCMQREVQHGGANQHVGATDSWQCATRRILQCMEPLAHDTTVNSLPWGAMMRFVALT